MVTHDPLCPMSPEPDPAYCCYSCDGYDCECDLISKVRADTIAKCIATVEELFTIDRWAGLYLAVNALRELQEKP